MINQPRLVPCSWCGVIGYSDEYLHGFDTFFCCEDHRREFENQLPTQEEDDDE